MATQIINKLRTPNTFRLYWLTNAGLSASGTVPDSTITLDFNPLIKEVIAKYGLLKNYCFMHWQAKPKGLRRFGVYDSATQNYLAGSGLTTELPSYSIQIDEKIHSTLPTAVMCYPTAQAYFDPKTELITIRR